MHCNRQDNRNLPPGGFAILDFLPAGKRVMGSRFEMRAKPTNIDVTPAAVA